MSNIKPLNGFALVREVKKAEKTTDSGLVVTGSLANNQLKRGTVVKVASRDILLDGTKSPEPEPVPEISVGDTVIYNSDIEVVDASGEILYFVNVKSLLGIEKNNG